MNYDKDSFMAGLAVGRMLWRPPMTNLNQPIMSIQIAVPPDTLAYSDGDALDYTGMVVNGYNENGVFLRTLNPWELILQPTVTYNPGESGAGMNYPEEKTTGTVEVTDVGSASEAFLLAIDTIANGVVDVNNVIPGILSELSTYDRINPIDISWVYGDDIFVGSSPLTIWIFDEVVVGDDLDLDDVWRTREIQTYGRRNNHGDPMQLERYWWGNRIRSASQGPSVPGSIHTLNASYFQSIPVQYMRYDGVIVSDSFRITIE